MSSGVTFAELRGLNNRLGAHLQGIQLAGQLAWPLAEEVLSYFDTGEAFVMMMLAHHSGDDERLHEVLAVGLEDEDLVAGVVAAFVWLPYEEVRPHLARLLRSEDETVRRIALTATIEHRQDPGLHLCRGLESPDPKTRGVACGLLGAEEGGTVLQKIAEQGNAYSEKAAALAVRCLPHRDAFNWQQHLAWQHNLTREAIASRLAADAWCLIAGIDLEDDLLFGGRNPSDTGAPGPAMWPVMR